MEKKFSKLNTFNKIWKNQESPLSRSFEGALFQSSNWVFGMTELVKNDENVDNIEFENQLSLKEIGSSLQVGKALNSEQDQETKTSNNKVVSNVPLNEKFKLKVLFVGDTYDAVGGDDLLGKMITAMKLTEGEFQRFQYDEKLENVNDLKDNLLNPTPESNLLFKTIVDANPQVVISLGATSTSILTGKREKLSNIHGQFLQVTFSLNNNAYNFQLMPLFHPDYLKINPNMKKAAWIDLQQVMKLIGKN